MVTTQGTYWFHYLGDDKGGTERNAQNTSLCVKVICRCKNNNCTTSSNCTTSPWKALQTSKYLKLAFSMKRTDYRPPTSPKKV